MNTQIQDKGEKMKYVKKKKSHKNLKLINGYMHCKNGEKCFCNHNAPFFSYCFLFTQRHITLCLLALSNNNACKNICLMSCIKKKVFEKKKYETTPFFSYPHPWKIEYIHLKLIEIFT